MAAKKLFVGKKLHTNLLADIVPDQHRQHELHVLHLDRVSANYNPRLRQSSGRLGVVSKVQD
jgi:hypothetical protein